MLLETGLPAELLALVACVTGDATDEVCLLPVTVVLPTEVTVDVVEYVLSEVEPPVVMVAVTGQMVV